MDKGGNNQRSSKRVTYCPSKDEIREEKKKKPVVSNTSTFQIQPGKRRFLEGASGTPPTRKLASLLRLDVQYDSGCCDSG